MPGKQSGATEAVAMERAMISKQMDRRAVLQLGMGLLACGVAWPQAGKLALPDTKAWKNLFEPDLSNAVVTPGGWVMEQGVLSAKDHSTIWTKESYGDFILDMEFKVSKDANSGVFLRAGDPKNVLSALEIQIHDNTDGTKFGMGAALYDAKAPGRNAMKPTGEWNRYSITCQGPKLSLVLNGEQVLDLNLDDWKEARKNPDGTPNKFAVALKDFSRRGPIGLQGLHGTAGATVWFRNMKVKALA